MFPDCQVAAGFSFSCVKSCIFRKIRHSAILQEEIDG